MWGWITSYIHPNQIPGERVQATRHEPNAVNESQLPLDLPHLIQRSLVFINRDVDAGADVPLVFSNNISKSIIELLPNSLMNRWAL